MAQLAKVVSVTGNAFVVAADGSRRPVKVGDIIQKDETVITAAGAHVEMMMNDGQMMAVAPEHSVRVDETMVHSEATPSAQDAAVQTATVDQVIQALDRGGDLTDQLEATAAGAGAGAGGDGSSFVRLLRISEGVEPLAYDYSLGAPAPINEVLLSATVTEQPTISVGVTVGTEIGTTPNGDGLITGEVIKGSVSGVDVVEGSGEGSKTVTFLITLDKVSSTDVTVTYTIQPGTASNPADFTDGALTKTVTIPAGYIGFAVTEYIVQDFLVEGNETFKIVLTDPIGASLVNDTATVTIVDDDHPPVANPDSATTPEDTPVLINVLNNDNNGEGSGSTEPIQVTGLVSGVANGTLVNHGDGTFTYTPNPGFEGQDTFVYSMTDLSGIEKQATVTITVGPDSTPTVDWILNAEQAAVVSEGGLPGGNLGGNTSTSGTLGITTGGDTINAVGGVVINGEDVTNGGTVHGTYGDLVVSVVGDVYNWTYTLNENAPHTDPNQVGSADQFPEETFAVVVSDNDGDSTSAANLTIQINDDGPTVPTVVTNGTEPVLLTSDGGLTGGNFNAGNLVGDTNTSFTVASVSFANAFTIGNQNDYGADGAGATTISYALGLKVAEGADSGLQTSANATIYLYENNGVITGSTSNTEGGITTGNTAFTLSVNGGTGVVTLTQYLPIDHTGSGTTTDLAQLGSGKVELVASAYTTDSEGDQTTTASAALDLGGNVQFADDGPTVPTVVTNGTEPVLLTSDGGLTGGNFNAGNLVGDTNTSFTVASVSFANAFTIGNQNDYGADGAGATTISYALGLKVAEGADSGLQTSANATIYLYENNGVITGSTSNTEGGITTGNTAFTLSVNGGTGVVTLTQYLPIDHTGSGTTTDLAQLGSGKVELVASAYTTDSEGDQTTTASAALDLGGNVQFADDGPTVPTVVTNGTEPVLLTSDGGLTGGNFNAGNLVGDTNTSFTVASVSFANAFTIGNQNDYGADGAGATTISYALGLKVAEGADSGLQTSANATIYLYENNGVITGSTSNTEGGITTGNTAFTLSVNGGTGVVTLTQYLPIDHTGSGTTTDLAQLGSGKVELVASAYTTDSEGDQTTTASAALDLGGNVQFADDGPTVPTVVTNGTEPVLLTSDGGLTGGNFNAGNLVGDTNTSFTVASVSFANAFTIGNQNDYGADGAGATTISYALGLKVAEGADSGLQTSANATIYLYENNGVITGSTSNTEGGITTGNTAFTLSVNGGTGVVTLTQYLPIDHTGSGTTTDLAQLGSGKVELVASAYTTDSEGDQTTTASAALDLGGNVQFADDGPTVPTVVTNGTEPVLLTSDGGLTGGNFNAGNLVGDTNTSFTVASVSFANAFTIGNQNDYGADGAGATTISYALGLKVAEGADSGLQTSANATIYLYENNGVITGSTSNTEGGITTGNTAFTLSVNGGTGVVTLTQYLPIDHTGSGTTTDLAQLGSGKVELVASAYTTDSEGDQTTTASAALDLGGNVQFADDGPRIIEASNLIASTGSGTDIGGVFSYSIGADANAYPTQHDFSSVELKDGTVSGLAIFNISAMTLVGSESATSVTYAFNFDYNGGPVGGTQTASGTLTFNKTTGTYTVDLPTPLTYSEILTTSATVEKFSYAHAGDVSTSTTSNPDVVVSKLSDNFYVQFSGFQKTTGQGATDLYADTTNTSDVNIAPGDTIKGGTGWVSISNSSNGVSGDTLGKAEVLDMDFFTTDPESNTSANPDAKLNGIFLKFDGIGNTEDLVIILKLENAAGTSFTTKTLIIGAEDIIKLQSQVPAGYNIQLDNNDGVVFIESNDFKTAGQDLYIVGAQVITSTENLTGSAYNLNGAVGEASDLTTPVTFGGASDPTDDSDVVKITDIGFITTTTSTPLADLNFEVKVQDADGDTSAAQTLNVLIINGETWTGSSAADTHVGTSANDALIGGAGNDSLSGLGGADVFQWHLGDQGSGSPARDVVDFNVKQGDVLDLRDLLVGEHNGTGATASNLTDYIHFGTDSGKLTLSVDHDAGTFAADQTIVLSNYADKAALAADLGLSSTAADVDILNKMIATGTLKTDV